MDKDEMRETLRLRRTLRDVYIGRLVYISKELRPEMRNVELVITSARDSINVARENQASLNDLLSISGASEIDRLREAELLEAIENLQNKIKSVERNHPRTK